MEQPIEQINSDEQITVESPVLKKGKLGFMTKKAFAASPPYWVVIILRTYFYSASGVSALIGASDFLSGKQSKILMFVMGAFGLVIGGLSKALGVVANDEK